MWTPRGRNILIVTCVRSKHFSLTDEDFEGKSSTRMCSFNKLENKRQKRIKDERKQNYKEELNISSHVENRKDDLQELKKTLLKRKQNKSDNIGFWKT